MYLVYENKDQTIDIYLNNKIIKKFYPNFNLDKSSNLLSEFNNLEDSNGKPLYTRWLHKGYYILPSIQERIYWDYFVGLVAYSEVLKFLEDKDYKIKLPKYYVNGRLNRMLNLLHGRIPFFKRILYNLIGGFLRKRFNQKHSIILNDDGFNGFRFHNFKKELLEIIPFHRVEILSFGNMRRLFFDRSTLPLGKFSLKKSNQVNKFKISDKLSKYISNKGFNELIYALDSICMDIIEESRELDRILDHKKLDMFLTYDQTETCNALLLSSKINSTITIAYQHGPFSNYHSGWIAYGIDSDHCNLKPNKLIVWGEYWKNFLSKISNKFSNLEIIVGAHLNKKIDYDDINFQTLKELNSPLKLLVPYEFLANNLDVSKYLEKFINLNINITIKLRPQGDGDIDSDLYSYSQVVQENSNFIYDLSDSELRNFDAVICTQSIFSVEMMRFNTPIWYLETSVPFLKNIADDGYAHLLNIEEVNSFKKQEDVYKYLKPKYNISDYKNIFSDISLNDQIKIIIGAMNND